MTKNKNPYKNTPFPTFKEVGKLNKKGAKEEMHLLMHAIDYHNKKYYIENDPAIDDKKFDKLFHRLEKLEQKFPDLALESSPTNRVGAKPESNLKKVKHQSVLLSLDSSDEEREIKKFVKEVKKNYQGKHKLLAIEPKFDGISVELFYKNEKLENVATRGDGKIGEDITKNAKKILSLPLQLPNKETIKTIAIRGEVLLKKDKFDEINKNRTKENKKRYANARNATAGIIRQLDPQKVPKGHFALYCFDILSTVNMQKTETHQEIYSLFEKWDIPITKHITYSNNFRGVKKYFKKMQRLRKGLNFSIDGIVIKSNPLSVREKMGTKERSPRWAFAWKFPPKQETTKLKDVKFQVGRTGKLTPIAILQPVHIGGVSIEKASLHNADEIKRKKLRIGDQVVVARAGDVIPEIIKRKRKGKERKKIEMPERCPVCNTEVTKEGVDSYCPAGLSCKAQLRRSLQHFRSRRAMNIKKLGKKSIRQLVKNNMVKELSDIYQLKKDDLQTLDGFAGKKATNLYQSIQKSKKVKLSKFIYALGIRHVGEHTALILAKKFQNIHSFYDLKKSDLAQISGIGDEVAESISAFFAKMKNQQIIEKLLTQGIELKPVKTPEEKTLKDKTIVITGELKNYTRNEIKEEIELLGGSATSSISKNTDYLIVGNDPGKKLDEAQKQGNVKIIDEEEYISIISN